MASSEQISAVIDGEQVTTGTWITTLDPSTGEALASVAACGPDEVDKAVDAARRAFDSGWSRTLPVERGRLLRALADRIRAEGDDLARQESRDTGKPLTQARGDVEGAARYYEYYGSVVEALHGDVIPAVADTHVFTRREPHGVTAHIVPWNYPLQITARTTAPALAAGNCCVVKPAEDAPLGALSIARMAQEVGFPAGVLNVVPGEGAVAGAALAAHRDIAHLSFTGSVPVGREVGAVAARNLVPAALELGGKSPNIVFDDADLEAAVPAIVGSIIQNAGQTCSAGARLLVHEAVHAEVVDRIRARFEELRVGPGVDDPDLGPLISAKQRDRVAALVSAATAPARVLTGGQSLGGADLPDGFYFAPTVVDDVPADSDLGQEEIFGPVLTVTAFGSEDEAVAIANGTRFGLVAAVWTRDLGRAHRLAERLVAGQVFVNTYGAGGGVELPFGGVKESGHGREKGFEALVAYTRTKTVAVRHAAPAGASR
jgi:aldehyde dehydrogenase (NAD+)